MSDIRYGIIDSRGNLLDRFIRDTRKGAQLAWELHQWPEADSWRFWYNRGYRCAKLQIQRVSK